MTEPINQIGKLASTDNLIHALHGAIATAMQDPRASIDLPTIHTALLLMARIVKGEIEWREARANA